jgi:hypothetical protein
MNDITTVPAELNGYPVIERAPAKRGRGMFTVMCLRTNFPEDPYVVATWYPGLRVGWVQGDYCTSAKEAAAVFKHRSA